MKRFVWLLFLILACGPLTAQDADGNILERQLAVRAELGRPSLYRETKKQLQDYYKRTDFSDPQRTTGWYRVDDFLKWLKQNDKILSADFYRYACTNEYQCTAQKRIKWLDLGARYAMHRYGTKLDTSKLSFVFCEDTKCMYLGNGKISLKVQSGRLFINDFNTAMHEITHAMPFLREGKDASLSELATFYTMFHYALPVKLEDCDTFACGARDFRTSGTTALRHRDGQLQYEYNAYIAALLLQKDWTPQQVLFFYTNEQGEKTQTLLWWEMLFALAFAKNDLYFNAVGGYQEACYSDSLNTQEFLQAAPPSLQTAFAQPNKFVYIGLQDAKMLNECGDKTGPVHMFAWTSSKNSFLCRGPYFPLSARQLIAQQVAPARVNERLFRFYQNALQELPEKLLTEWRLTYPGINREILELDRATLQDKIANQYEHYFIDAALKALAKENIPPAVVPYGYM